ncbi:hypothetical protein PR003_g25448 [Phytophthora rubi]|uniref:Crinkler effector protein N-terminal domain-containing protein n=1 Tax=Phytophthora rubi TaxID=129364 RepID=A0A6A4CIR6_9STRA|nr:hypothetical protein PR002_g24387 [Phytophthora rubi]KAE9289809.1 hypothetical protein PR003_g25448 [Phytophthora rubi]
MKIQLWCLVLGAETPPFGVLAEPNSSVESLRFTIKGSSSALHLVGVERIRLYVAKQENGEWLALDAPQLQTLMRGDQETTASSMCGSRLEELDKVRDHFQEVDAQNIHILVKVDEPTVEFRNLTQLQCLFVWEDKGTFVSLDVKTTDRLEQLQVAIKEEMAGVYPVGDARRLELYASKNWSGEWLNSKADMRLLVKGERSVVDTWLRRRIDPMSTVGDLFSSSPAYSTQDRTVMTHRICDTT